MPAAAKVLVLYTGGTIGMVPSDPNNPTSPLHPAPKEELLQYVPKALTNLDWDLVGLDNPLDSSNIGPDHWEWMAAVVKKHYANYDGFVILHGTDTMAYTSSALSFLFHNLAKPVVLTGSQLPIFVPNTDAVMNFINALTIAGWKATNLPCLPEVVICFADTILRGNRATKISTSHRRSFDTPNFPHLGSIGRNGPIINTIISPVSSEDFCVHNKFDRQVMMFSLYPGMQDDHLQTILTLPDVKGYVMRSFGAGNAPSHPNFLKIIDKATKSGKIILNITQCLNGMVEMGHYATSSALLASGVLSGLDMTPEAALTKLMWLLGSVPEDEISLEVQINQRGELASIGLRNGTGQ